MVKIVEMDEDVTLKSQLEEDLGPVILLNKFTVKHDDVNEFLKVFATTTEMFKKQPGFVSAQLHRGIGGSSTFLTTLFGSLQNILNKLLINRSSDQAWPTYFLIPQCLRIYSRKLQCLESVWTEFHDQK